MNDKNQAEVDIVAELSLLTAEIAANQNDDTLYYLRGRLYWRLGQKSLAISDYECAVALNSGSPASAALKIARDVMDFYNKDLYNP